MWYVLGFMRYKGKKKKGERARSYQQKSLASNPSPRENGSEKLCHFFRLRLCLACHSRCNPYPFIKQTSHATRLSSWKEVGGEADFGLNECLFRGRIDTLLATRLSLRLSHKLLHSVTAKCIFANQTSIIWISLINKSQTGGLFASSTNASLRLNVCVIWQAKQFLTTWKQSKPWCQPW